MSKDEQFFTDRSNLIHYLTDYIQLCQDVGRNVPDELEEALYEAFENCDLKMDFFIENEND